MDKKILLVDDAAFMRMLIRNTLTTNGYTNILEASDGEIAVSTYAAEKPDLVIFTGDQIKGYSKKFKKDPAIIEGTIDTLVEPIAKRNIPFMVTYGNHDAQCGVDNRGQYKFYAKYDNFISGDLRNADDVGTAYILFYL